MGNTRVGGLCRCPYYHGARKNSLVCEGLIPGTFCEARFPSPDDRVAYQEEICAHVDRLYDYQLCPVFRALSHLKEG